MASYLIFIAMLQSTYAERVVLVTHEMNNTLTYPHFTNNQSFLTYVVMTTQFFPG